MSLADALALMLEINNLMKVCISHADFSSYGNNSANRNSLYMRQKIISTDELC